MLEPEKLLQNFYAEAGLNKEYMVGKDAPRTIEEPYVCIAVQASGVQKCWLRPGGWDEIVRRLKAARNAPTATSTARATASALWRNNGSRARAISASPSPAGSIPYA